jgi:hypothetical protein
MWAVVAASLAAEPQHVGLLGRLDWRRRIAVGVAFVGLAVAAFFSTTSNLSKTQQDLSPSDIAWVAPSAHYAPADPVGEIRQVWSTLDVALRDTNGAQDR